MSARVQICEVCGWQDESHRWKPGHCPCCLEIKEMFRTWVPIADIAKQLRMPNENLRYVIRQLELKRPGATCPVCGWHGWLVKHKPSSCARKLLVRTLSEAGMTASAIARELGVSRNLIFLTTRRMGIKCSRGKAGLCTVCGWHGVISYHDQKSCAHCLRLRQMHVAGLPRRVIARELGITDSELYYTLQRLGFFRKTPEQTSAVQLFQRIGSRKIRSRTQ